LNLSGFKVLMYDAERDEIFDSLTEQRWVLGPHSGADRAASTEES